MEFSKSEQNLVKRGAHKATYNKEEIYSILDSSLICTIAFKVDDKAFVQPINFGRKEDTLFVHGSLQNRMTNSVIESGEACINVFHLDSMKLTRSAFHHSVNFRSAVIFGKVRELKTNEEKIPYIFNLIETD